MNAFAKHKQLVDRREAIVSKASRLLEKATSEKRDLDKAEDREWNGYMRQADELANELKISERRVAMDRDPHNSSDAGRREPGREDWKPSNDPMYGAHHSDEYRKDVEVRALRKFMGWGMSGLDEDERAAIKIYNPTPEETRALSAVTGSAGAYTIPQAFQYDLEVALKYYGGILQAADYVNTDMGNLLPYPSMNDTGNSGEIIAENSAAAGATGGGSEQDPAFGVTNFNAYMFDTGFVLLPIQLVQDSAFNVENFLTDALNTRIGRRLNTKCTVGSGSSEPTGVLTAATLGQTGGSATAITYTDLLNLEHAVDRAYRQKPTCAWMFHDSTFKAIKGLVDSNGRPLFIAGGVSEGIQNKAPGTLMGFNYFINNDMPAIGASNKPILFGDFSKYKIRRVRDAQMIRLQERFIDKLQFGYIVFQRFDGNIVDGGTHPIQYLQNASS